MTKDEEPTLKDCKKNMIIPYMADMVLLIHRNRLRNEIEKQEGKFNIAKNNRGCAGFDIPVTFNLKTAAFYMEKEEYCNSIFDVIKKYSKELLK